MNHDDKTGSASATAKSDSKNENPGSRINYDLFLDCIHCGLCTSACPTYVELGDENDGPRGRIYLMRAVTDGRLAPSSKVQRHLDLCLDCRACETACPSGVQYGQLIEPFRAAMNDHRMGRKKQRGLFNRFVVQGMFPYPRRLRWGLMPARLAQRVWLDRLVIGSGLWRLLPRRLGRLVTLLPRTRQTPQLPHILPPKGHRRACVALFTGCVADTIFREMHWATARVLQENGCEVFTLRSQACCGAIHHHSGDDRRARELADLNTEAFNLNRVDAILVNVAGCGAMLKDYGHLWSDERQGDRKQLASKVRDVCEFLDDLGMEPPPGELNVTATYHDACHLAHAQQIREQPRRLLSQIPGLKLVDLPEAELCCGAAGTYNLTEPEMADRLGRRKLENILQTEARVVITANAGCQLQIAREARLRRKKIKIVHPMELLDLSYRRKQL
jgi:glycolate oxidase iron-sulfur subunit